MWSIWVSDGSNLPGLHSICIYFLFPTAATTSHVLFSVSLLCVISVTAWPRPIHWESLHERTNTRAEYRNKHSVEAKRRFGKCVNKHTDSYSEESVSVSLSLVKLTAARSTPCDARCVFDSHLSCLTDRASELFWCWWQSGTRGSQHPQGEAGWWEGERRNAVQLSSHLQNQSGKGNAPRCAFSPLLLTLNQQQTVMNAWREKAAWFLSHY